MAAIGVCRPQRELTIFLHAHLVGDVADRGRRAAARGFAHQGGGAGAVALLDEVHFQRELSEPHVDGSAQLSNVCSLNRGFAD